MGRVDRVKDALWRFMIDNEKKVKETYAEKKVPADYSLGALNTAIFIYHQMNGTPKLAKYYSRYDNSEMEIGCYPIPVALKDPKRAHADNEFRRVAIGLIEALQRNQDTKEKYEDAIKYCIEQYDIGEAPYEPVPQSSGEQKEQEIIPTADEHSQDPHSGDAGDELPRMAPIPFRPRGVEATGTGSEGR